MFSGVLLRGFRVFLGGFRGFEGVIGGSLKGL